MASDLDQAFLLAAAPFPGSGCCDLPSVEYVGNMGDPALKAGDCENPGWLFCVRCGAQGVVRCNTSRRSRCKGCASRYRGRVEELVRMGIEVGTDSTGNVLSMTASAPGAHQHCMAYRHKNCAGEGPTCRICPCTPEGGIDVGEWNAGFTARMNRVMTAIRRGECSPLVDGKRQAIPVAYYQTREPQDGKRTASGVGRYALHPHCALYRTDGQELVLDRRELRALLISHGFGHEFDVQELKAKDAWYFAKYVSDSADCRDMVPFGYDGIGRKRKATYRAWTASRNWPVSMRSVKEAQLARYLDQLARAIAGLAQPGPPLDVFNESYAKGARVDTSGRPDGMDDETWYSICAESIGRNGP